MKLKLFLTISCAGLPGCIAMAWLLVPQFFQGIALPAPIWAISLASGIQSAILLGVMTATGIVYAAKVGLQAPVFDAIVESEPLLSTLRPQLLPGFMGGLVGALILWLFTYFSPDALLQLQEQFSTPLLVRILYGGITEEILVRWGLMSFLVWFLRLIAQTYKDAPMAVFIWIAIVTSSLIFGAGHLPFASSLLGPLPIALALYIISANAAFGIVAGYLFWRNGLEAAIIAHILAHLMVFLVSAGAQLF